MTRPTHAGPTHERDCLAAGYSDATCRCARAAWLDEVVPRHVARAELLTQLERWAREQGIFETGYVETLRSASDADVRSRSALLAGVDAAVKITRQHYGRLAVTALNMRKECNARPRPEVQA